MCFNKVLLLRLRARDIADHGGDTLRSASHGKKLCVEMLWYSEASLCKLVCI